MLLVTDYWLLMTFCSPTHLWSDPAGKMFSDRNRPVMDAEMSSIIKSIPLTAGREMLPAASIEEVRELIQGTDDDSSSGQPGLSPHILHFAGHGENYNGNGYILFVRQDSKGNLVSKYLPSPGSTEQPDPKYWAGADALVDILKSIHGKKRLKCIFLNACLVLNTLGKRLHEAYPDVTVIGFSTKVESKAAAAFAKGFYKCIGEAIQNGKSDVTPKDAYNAAVKAWNDGGYRVGDPDTPKIDGTPALTKADEGKFLAIRSRAQLLVQADPAKGTGNAGQRAVRWADVENSGPGKQDFFLKILSVEERVGGLVEMEGKMIKNPEEGWTQRDHGVFGIYEGKAVV